MSDLRKFFLDHARLLSFGILFTFASSFGQSFFISLSAEQLQAEFNLNHSDFGLLYSAATLLSAAVLLWSGQLVDRRSLKTVSLSVIIGLSSGCALMASADSLGLLFFALFLLRHCGQGLMGHTATTSMIRYIDRQRGLALSTTSLGFSLGEAILPLAGVALISAFGWRNNWYAVSGGLVLLLPIAWLLLNGRQTQQRALAAEQKEKKDVRLSQKRRDWTRAEVLRDRRYYLFLPALLAPGFIGTGLVIHQGAFRT
jgi:MFS family permease